MSKFLNELNNVQRQAVTTTDGASLVIAGAGSGKTRVLTFRIAYLLQKGVPAGSILALTFTNKAAKEMKERIAKMVGEDAAKNLWMGTFHSKFATILRYEAEHLGFPKSFTIYDTLDAKNAIKQIVRDLNLDEQIYKPNEILSRISMAKNNLITAEAYQSNAQVQAVDKSTRKPELGRVYQYYATRCKNSGAMDFDDLLLNTNILFRDHPEILAKYQHRFKYILVDEYQDTNFSQYLIIKRLAEKNKNICVVGDDAQSIYSFRGAKIENILNFKKDYPDYNFFKLEQNYRSTQNIVEAANSLISKNKEQIKKNVFSENSVGDKIKVLKAFTDGEEGFLVSNSIFETALRKQLKFSDFAILYRTNAQSRIFEESLRKVNVPYKIYGGISFYQRKEIKDLISYFRLIINRNDDEALRRIINYPIRGIGKTTVARLDEAAHIKQQSLWEVIQGLDQYNPGLNQGTITKIRGFIQFIEVHSDGIENKDAYDSAYQIAVDTGILKDLHNDKSPEALSKYENVQELLNGIKDFSSLEKEDKTVPLVDFLENVALLTDQDSESEEDNNKVTLMTIHSAKGLEFKHIYVVGMEEGLFPSNRTAGNQQELEEERRLFYVAITRAEDKATISYALSRYKWGNPESCSPSRFIKEINPSFLDMPEEDDFASFTQRSAANRPKPGDTAAKLSFKKHASKPVKKGVETVAPPQAKPNLKRVQHSSSGGFSSDNSYADLVAGASVEHERFGVGKILNIEGVAPNKKATVFFQSAGQKQLLLKFAKLKVIG